MTTEERTELIKKMESEGWDVEARDSEEFYLHYNGKQFGPFESEEEAWDDAIAYCEED